MVSIWEKFKNLINKEKDEIINNETLNENFETDFNLNVKLEGDTGDKLEIDKEIENMLYKKGKKATCKILSKNEDNNNIGTGFFTKIPYFEEKMKVLLTNNHILNNE